MNFAHPQWLWGIALLPLLYLFAVIDDKRRQGRFGQFADARVWKMIAPEYDPGAKIRKTRLTLLSLLFMLLALARPQWGMHEEVAHANGLDIMIVLDVSTSMETEDVVPSRLQKSKHLIRTLADRLEGDRVGLIGFAGGASVACPLTTDINYLLETVQIISPRMIPSQGTDIGVGLDTAVRALDRGAEEESQASENGPPTRAIILITDGEDHEDKGLEVAQKLKKKGIRLYVLGVGTQKGAPIPLRDQNGNLTGYKKDRHNQSIVSAFHPDTLLQLAAAAGGRYWNVTTDEGEAAELIQDLGGMTRSEFAERHYMVYEERFQWPLAVAVLLFLLELSLAARRMSPEGKGRVSAIVARRLFPFAGILTLFLLSSIAHASPVETYIENEKGIKAYQDGKMDEAKQDFGKAQALDPLRAELQYNQGLIQLQEGKVDDAIRSFTDSATQALKTDPDLAARSLYNMGVAQGKKGDIKGAVKSYLAAINGGFKTKDGSVEQSARKNLELLLKDQQKQKQQQQQQKQNQSQNQQQQDQQQQQKQDQTQTQTQTQNNQSDQKKNQSQNGQEQDKNNKDQEKDKDKKGQQQQQQYAEPQKQKFNSKSLSPDDADRVVSELSNREKELQKRLKVSNGRAQDNPQDW